MPILKNRNYVPSRWMYSGHIQTIVPAVFRKSPVLPFERERIVTPDNDFLDLDWLRNGSRRLVIVSHGLEGNSLRPYMVGMAQVFANKGWDVLNWNFRGCSGELNKQPHFYHSGATYDLATVVKHAAPHYTSVSLVGFSLGGNLTLKYLGEAHPFQEKVHRAVTISVPLELGDSCDKISRPGNRIYARRFLSSLKSKIVAKSKFFPDRIPLEPLTHIKDIRAFDNFYTGPLHGFEGAEDYYAKNSSIHFLQKIKQDVLIINARNDPFLSDTCFPVELGSSLANIFMEFPNQGGHVGFKVAGKSGIYWSENRAFEFIEGYG